MCSILGSVRVYFLFPYLYVEVMPHLCLSLSANALAAHNGQGWPNAGNGDAIAKDLSASYSLDVMETGSDILFFWVARMAMLCEEVSSVELGMLFTVCADVVSSFQDVYRSEKCCCTRWCVTRLAGRCRRVWATSLTRCM